MSGAKARVLVEVVALIGVHPVGSLLTGRVPVVGGEDEILCTRRVRRLRDVRAPERIPDGVAAGATC